MDTNVIFIEEQIHWLYQLPPSHINIFPQSFFSSDEKDLLKVHIKKPEVFRPRNLSGAVIREGL